MKALTTPSGNFGPFTSIEVLEDRYRCWKAWGQGEDLPFSVVGTGTIVDADTIAWPAPPAPPVDTAPILAELDAIDKKSIRALREWAVTGVVPQILKDRDAQAAATRKKLK